MDIKLIAIVGPTASGKSELAVEIAKKFNGEIISADSRQIYKGLNLGTGKVNGKLITRDGKKIFIYKTIPHYCIDCISPKKQYSVAEFAACAKQAIADIAGRGKIPILVGGTGFWVDAVVYNMKFPDVPPNLKLRKILERKNPAELLQMLTKLDPRRANTIEQKNPRRLIRAIEIVRTLGRVPMLNKKSPYHILWLGLQTKKDILRTQIHKRLLQRLRAGMIHEARLLHKNGLSWKRFYELGLEYRALAEHLRGKTTKDGMMIHLERAILHYARRQMVWFRKNKKIRWIQSPHDATRLMEKFL